MPPVTQKTSRAFINWAPTDPNGGDSVQAMVIRKDIGIDNRREAQLVPVPNEEMA